MNEIVKETLSDYLNEDGKLNIPSKAKRILFDIGASINAPHSEVWTRGNDDRIKDRCDSRIKFDHLDEHVFLVLL